MPFDKPIETVTEHDLKALLWAGAPDSRVCEFKPQLPATTIRAQRAFLGEVSSFANALGGHIFFGMKEGDREPVGLLKESAKDAMGWLEQATLNGIAPRIPGLRFRLIELQNGNAVLMIRVPKTWAGPHMVVYREANQFYSRNTAGVFLMDVDELRTTFSLGEACREKMRSFRLERVNAIMNRELSVRLSDSPKTILHILPVSSFRAGFRIDLNQVESGEAQIARPMAARGLISHYNFDGLITFSAVEKYAYSYIQVFRNGCMEATESLLLEPRDGRKIIPSAMFEKELIQCGNRLLTLLHHLKIEPPYVVMLSFLGVRGYSMFVGTMRWQSNAHHIERDHLFVDEVIIDDVTQDFAKAIRPAFDQVWNACGWARSLNYDAEGNWREHLY